jgi:hypothetical protein
MLRAAPGGSIRERSPRQGQLHRQRREGEKRAGEYRGNRAGKDRDPLQLPEAHALEGISLLSEAQQVPVQRRLKSLSQPTLAAPCFSFSLAWRARLVGPHAVKGCGPLRRHRPVAP